MIRVTSRMPDLARLNEHLLEATRSVMRDVAREAPREQARLIAERRRPNGAPQKANAPSTVRRKGHDLPLRDAGLLANPAAYPIRQTERGAIALLPPTRREVVRFLRRKGYGVWGVSARLRAFAVQRWREESVRLRDLLPSLSVVQVFDGDGSV